jgi:cytochrome c-type biogenesis protein CcmH/NrfG
LKRIVYEQRIAKMKNDGLYLKLRQIEKLKGKIKENPADPEKWMSV